MKIFNNKEILLFLCLVLVISLFCNLIVFILEPYSILYNESGKVTFQYILYALVGIFIETPTPFIALYLTKKILYDIRIKDFFKDIFKQDNWKKTVITLLIVFLLILIFSIINGKRNNNSLILIFVSFPVLIIGGGIEEVGWRGFLQVELEKKMPFMLATITTALIWYSWHLPLWLQPSSNHYGDSLVGFLIMIITWSFLLATIKKITKSTFACVCVHAWVNTMGAVYDWNELFDSFPTRIENIICYSLVIICSIIIWHFIDKKDKLCYNGKSDK